jgi:[protein-PII] uridylyltransferase
MATKSFLTAKQIEEAGLRLQPPPHPPDGDEKKIDELPALVFSQWLSEKLLSRLSLHPEWLAAGPVALGSWSRGELCPKSDIDVLFSGGEESVARLKEKLELEGLKLRYRMPEDPNDWTVGVEPFDVLALFSAVALSPESAIKLKDQQALLRAQGARLKRGLVRAMVHERNARSERFDSISNFLEPNLKYGTGGLRDLEQALILCELYPERFGWGWVEDGHHALEVLNYCKRFFILIRQKLNLSEGATELLSAPEQKPIADWLGFNQTKDFMREVQKALSRVSFYSDWMFEQATKPVARIKAVEKNRLTSIEDLLESLKFDSSVLMQSRVRLASDAIFSNSKRDERLIGRRLTEFIRPSGGEESMVALFRSRLIDHCVPEFRKIVGHVQHDQYHRFAVDTHILQALRELKRIAKKPSLIGRLATVAKGLSGRDWEILSFACLYHDIAKGREGDHSVLGVQIAARDLAGFGKDAVFIREVLWIVEQHLSLSAAAFRENPRSPKTWAALASKGVTGKRLALLTVFTVVDIRATNPDAWTAWKERLLHELVTQLGSPETGSTLRFAEALKAAGLETEWIERLDAFLLGAVPTKTLVEDIRALSQARIGAGADAPLKIVRIRGGSQTWIRFHMRRDRAGLFREFVTQMARAGLSIRHASIYTDDVIGVYDWFEVKTAKTPAQVKKLLEMTAVPPRALERESSVLFDSIELTASDSSEWVVSFRGRDQQGALLQAARALSEEGVQILWAKVHTWGRQIDDVFGISGTKEAGGEKVLLEKLHTRLVAGRKPNEL